jgi:hypothetical protein
VIQTAQRFEDLPSNAIILWDRCTFRGQFYAKHMSKGGKEDVERWPALLSVVAEMGRLQAPGETSQTARNALEK